MKTCGFPCQRKGKRRRRTLHSFRTAATFRKRWNDAWGLASVAAPQDRRARHDVPEFYGDARGKTFHTRAGAFALGNDARRSVNGWMEERRGEGSAGSLPRVQRM